MVAKPSLAQVTAEACGPVTGLTDYRKKTDYGLQVEKAHFPAQVENWTRGHSGPLGADIDYTIQRIPNHHRALASIARQAERAKKDQLPVMQYPVECYFERAVRFTPDDHVVRMLYAQFLISRARVSEATKQLEQADRLVPDNPFTMYNIGLVYFDMKDYAHALAYAHKAMAMGLERPELRQQLESVGRWTEPETGASSPSTSTVPATAPSPASSAAVGR